MARDHALALGLAAGRAALRLYSWDIPTLSLGRNEPARGRYDATRARALGIGIVRRPTGGRAVLHWRELTYAVAFPARLPATPSATLGARTVYHWINTRLALALASVGVPAEIAPAARSVAPPDAGACFRSAAPGEVVAGGCKLVGSAQVRIEGGLLQHGSILIEDDQGLLAELGVPGSGPAPATLCSLLGRPPAAGELEGALLAAFDAPVVEDPLPCASERELEERYRSEEWTWRR